MYWRDEAQWMRCDPEEGKEMGLQAQGIGRTDKECTHSSDQSPHLWYTMPRAAMAYVHTPFLPFNKTFSRTVALSACMPADCLS